MVRHENMTTVCYVKDGTDNLSVIKEGKVWEPKMKIDLFEDNLQLSDLEEYLSKYGSEVTDLNVCSVCTNYDLPAIEVLRIISQYCKKLKHLKMSFVDFTEDELKRIPNSVFPSLKSLRLSGVRWAHSEPMLSYLLKQAVNLQELSLISSTVDGFSLLNLSTKCKMLSIPGCTRIDDAIFMKILNKCPNLEKLNISKTNLKPDSLRNVSDRLTSLNICGMDSFFSDSAFPSFETLSLLNLRQLDISGMSLTIDNKIVSIIAKKCPLLEALNLNGSSNVNNVGFATLETLKNLKNLDVGYTEIGDNSFASLAEMLPQLERVNCCYCRYLTESGLTRFVFFCPKLTFLDITGNSHRISNQFFKSASKYVEERSNTSLTIQLELNSFPKDHTKLTYLDEANRLGLKRINDYPYKTTTLKIIDNSICNWLSNPTLNRTWYVDNGPTRGHQELAYNFNFVTRLPNLLSFLSY